MSGSRYQSRGFSVDYYERLSLGAGWLGTVNISLQSWRHSISSFGGFNTAEFVLTDSQVSIDDWVANGLGRKIVASDETLVPMWEGFVDQITVNYSGLNLSIGPMTTIANRVFAIYSGVNTAVYPPVIGVRKKTPTQNNLTSQQVWGIWPEVLSLAGVTDANADQLVAMYLKEHSNPDKNSDFSFGSGGQATVTVKCQGWYTMLNHPYNYTLDAGGTIAISTRLSQVILAQHNPGWVSTNFDQIQVNSTQIKSYQNDDRLALEQIKGYAAMGDILGNRWLFGVYEDRKPFYYPVDNNVAYQVFLQSPRQAVLDLNSGQVPAWRIRPGRWAFFADFMPGLGAPYNDLLTDPRAILIEQVDFDVRVPAEMQIKGGKTSSYEQQSARLGLRGTDV